MARGSLSLFLHFLPSDFSRFYCTSAALGLIPGTFPFGRVEEVEEQRDRRISLRQEGLFFQPMSDLVSSGKIFFRQMSRRGRFGKDFISPMSPLVSSYFYLQ